MTKPGLLLLALLVLPLPLRAQQIEPPEGATISSAQVSGFDLGRLSPGLQQEIARLAGGPLNRERLNELAARIEEEQPVLLVGAGHLGTALIAYPGWKAYRFHIAAVFDKDPDKIGTRIRRLPVLDFETLEEANRVLGARLGIIAVPAWEAQAVADQLVQAGVTGIINFAPIRLNIPEQVIVREVCFICELTVLSFLVEEREAGARDATRSGPDLPEAISSPLCSLAVTVSALRPAIQPDLR